MAAPTLPGLLAELVCQGLSTDAAVALVRARDELRWEHLREQDAMLAALKLARFVDYLRAQGRFQGGPHDGAIGYDLDADGHPG